MCDQTDVPRRAFRRLQAQSRLAGRHFFCGGCRCVYSQAGRGARGRAPALGRCGEARRPVHSSADAFLGDHGRSRSRKPGLKILLNLLAGVGLLVWGTHIVRTGILRIWGGDLRRFLRESVSNRHAAFAAGLGITALIQSSTATAVMVASCVGQWLIATAPALAVMLGADVGTALMTLGFSFDLSWLSPLLIFLGVTLFRSEERR